MSCSHKRLPRPSVTHRCVCRGEPMLAHLSSEAAAVSFRCHHGERYCSYMRDGCTNRDQSSLVTGCLNRCGNIKTEKTWRSLSTRKHRPPSWTKHGDIYVPRRVVCNQPRLTPDLLLKGFL